MKAMIYLYCKANHDSFTIPCYDCEELTSYAFLKLDKCPYGNNKPACSKCSIHCYEHNKRNKIKSVMRYAGPRMLYTHPALAIKYLLTKIRFG